MAENPLLPNAELRALLALVKRCKDLDTASARKAGKAGSKAFRSPPSREALLAGTSVQLKPGDLLLGEPNDTTAVALSPVPRGAQDAGVALLPAAVRPHSRLFVAAAMAAALNAAGTDGLVLAYARDASDDPEWPGALAWAQERLLPLILVCADPRGPAAFQPGRRAAARTFSYEAVRRHAAKIQLPLLTVDGEDAVAVYRVMQESALRARAGGGPALLWAMLPSRREVQAGRARSRQPLRRLEQYLRARSISF